jgi:PPOX class probable FMN-dependent enzyme
MDRIDSIAGLEAHYGKPDAASLKKVTAFLTPAYRRWVEASRFCILTTVGSTGTDGSPRGDDGPVVTVLDPQTLAMPDWRGNNRLDSLRNIVEDGRVSLMLMVPGNINVIRINGSAIVTTDPDLRARFEREGGKQPATVIVIQIAEVYSQCARALMRSALWKGDYQGDLPSVGDMLDEISSGEIDGGTYDAEWMPRAKKTMW